MLEPEQVSGHVVPYVCLLYRVFCVCVCVFTLIVHNEVSKL